MGPPDQRINIALDRLGIEVDAVSRKRIVLFRCLFSSRFGFVIFFIGTARRTRFAGTWLLGDSVRNKIDRVVAGHVPLSQEIGGVAFALGKQRDQHIGSGHFVSAGVLNVNDGALYDALKTGGGLGFFARVHDKAFQFLVDIFGQRVSKLVDIDVASTHDRGGVFIIAKREKKMLQRGVFVLAFVRCGQRAAEALFEGG